MRAWGLRPSGWWLAAAVLVAVSIAAVPAIAVDTAPISGRVTDSGGSGISGVIVSAVLPMSYQVQGSATTDADGYYTIDGLSTSLGGLIVTFDPATRNVIQSSDYVAEIYNDASAYLSATQVPPGTTGVNAVLAEGGSISGHVYGPDSITGLAGVPVSAFTGGSLTPGTVSGAGGAYQIRGIPVGDSAYASVWTAQYNADNDTDYLNTGTSGFLVSAGADTSGVDLVLGQGGRIEGTVTGGGAPLGGIQVSAYASMMFSSYNAYTASDGTYVLRGVEPRAAESGYSVSFYPSEYNAANGTGYATQYFNGVHASAEATPVGVVAGVSAQGIDGALVEGGSISGTVYDADGVTPLEGVRVSANMTGSFDVTDAEGRYTLRGLSTASYRVFFNPTDYNTTHTPGYYAEYYDSTADLASAAYVPVTFGLDTSGIDATLDRQAGTISGTVFDADGVTPLEGVDVWFVDGMGMPYNFATTAANGTYTLGDVSASGQYVWFATWDYNTANGTNYISEYYDGASYMDAATSVAAGATNINATLESAGSISGTVYAANGVTPLEGVEVWAGWMVSTTTAADGTYTLSGLSPGTYGVRFETANYNLTHSPALLTEWYQDTYSQMNNKSVRVTSGTDTPNIDATLDPASVITGTVYAPDGTTGLGGIPVYVSRQWDGSGDWWWGAFYTGSDGSYTAHMPPGTYSVSFDPSMYNSMNGTGYVREWWENDYTGNSDNITLVTVGPAATAFGIDATFEVGGSISGTVLGPDGLGLAGIQVSASVPMSGGVSANTGEGGAYTIRGLAPGSYVVEFNTFLYNWTYDAGLLSEFYLDVRWRDDADPVTVTLGVDTPDINAQLEQGGTISGTVYAADGVTPLSDVSVGASPVASGMGASSSTGVDGAYTIKGLVDGDHRVSFNASSRNNTNDTDYISEYYNGTPDWASATPVPVTIAADTPGIDATLDAGGSISGRVFGPDGTTPVSGIYVYASGALGGCQASTDSTGTYVIHGLAPDSYKVSFAPFMHNMMNNDGLMPEYYNNVRTQFAATPVGVQVGQRTGPINATLEQGGIITGTVYGPDGITGLSGVQVHAQSGDGLTGGWAYTDYDGHYTMNALSEGAYTVRFDPFSYNAINDEDLLWEYSAGTRVQDNAQEYTVALGDVITDVDATLDVGARLGGVVTGDAGAPLAGVDISIIDLDTGDPLVAWTGTDGSWKARGVAPGSYGVAFSPIMYNLDNGTDYVRQFWNGQSSLATADAVTVGLADVRTDLDAQLVRGGLTLTVNLGLPVDPASCWRWIDVYERLDNGSELYVVSVELTGPTTTAEIPGLLPGNYLVRADVSSLSSLDYWASWAYDGQPSPSWYDAPVDVEDIRMAFADPIEMTTEDRTVQMNAPDFGHATGEVVDSDGGGLPGVCIEFLAQTALGEWIPVAWTWSEYSGAFEARLVPGTYKVHYTDEYDYLGLGEAWYLDKAALADAQTVVVTAGATTDLDPQVLPLADQKAPTTTLGADPVAANGENGWYTSLSVTLTSDEPGSTWYSYDPSGLPKTAYTGPFTPTEGTGTLYYWSVDAADNTEVAQPWAYKLDTADPAAPTGLSATADGYDAVDLSWDAVTDAHSGTAAYLVYLADHTYVGENEGTTYRATGLDPATEYTFYVKTKDNAGRVSAASTTAGDTTGAAPEAAPIYRLYNTVNGNVFYTADEVEVDEFLTTEPGLYVFEGIAYFTDPVLDTAPVWRFHHVLNDTYMYTASAAERDMIIALWPSIYSYEGEVFRVGTSSGPGATPVYRFYRSALGDHFYTAALAERDAVIASYPTVYTYEGIAFHVNGGLTTASGTGSISGTVTDPDGAALSGIWVRATTEMGTWSALTGGDGTYTITGLPAGGFGVTFSTWPNHSSGGWDLLPEYYPDAHTWADALPVTVAADAATENIDAQLEGPSDTTPPTTTATVDRATPNGADGWYLFGTSGGSSAPQITLTADEAASTYYHWDAETPALCEGAIPMRAGDHTLTYWSVDISDNEETPHKTVQYKYDPSGPTAPGNLSAQALSPTSVRLTWDASTDNYSGVKNYAIDRKLPTPYARIGETVGTETTIDLTGLSPSTAYTFVVFGSDVAGWGGSASEVSVTTPAAPTPPALKPVYRFYNSRLGTHFYTASEAEMNNVKATLSHIFTFEGPAYFMNPAANAQPLYRFYLKSSGTHFYTANEAEKAKVINTLSHVYGYEGPAYNVSSAPGANRTTVYRFYHRTNGTHFYTASEAEKAHVQNSLSHVYGFEGPAFWIGK